MARDITYHMKSTGEDITLHISDEMEPYILKEGEECIRVERGAGILPPIPCVPCIVRPLSAEEWRKLL